jgi:predicted nucleic acid-binding protein
MLAVEPNLIVRYLTGDHPGQSAKARAVIDGEDVFVSTTVLLETEWVLRSVYSFDSTQVCAALRAFAGLPRVSQARRWWRPRLIAQPKAWILPMPCISAGRKIAVTS